MKKGISLIVLVITIIVMIILAAAVVISLNNTGTINKANEAVNMINQKEVEQFAALVWAEEFTSGKRGETLKEGVLDKLKDYLPYYDIDISDTGITVNQKGEDKTAPTLIINTPDSKDSQNPTIVNNTTFTVEGTALDNCRVKNIRVEYFNGGIATATVIPWEEFEQDDSWKCDVELTKDETTAVTVIATDINGNTTTEVRYVCCILSNAGLYQAESNYTVLLKSWDELISDGTITADGKVVKGEESYLNGELMLPNTLTSIPAEAYKGCTALTNVNIPNSVIEIGNYAFHSSAIKTISIPDSVTTVGEGTFYNCTKLLRVDIGNGLTNFSSQMFRYCTALTSIGPKGSGASVEIPNNIKGFNYMCFMGCSKITSVVIPDHITAVGSRSLSGCMMQSLIIPEGVTGIYSSAFENCSALESITIPSTVNEIGQRAFLNCSKLKSITIPSNVKSLYEDTFCNCSNLENVTMLNISSIGKYVFQNCTKLTALSFGGTVEEWNKVSLWTDWNENCGEIVVTCTDGTVTIPAYAS